MTGPDVVEEQPSCFVYSYTVCWDKVAILRQAIGDGKYVAVLRLVESAYWKLDYKVDCDILLNTARHL